MSWPGAYATGEVTLYNLDADPCEQQNRLADPACAAVARELDARLTPVVMRLITGSHAPERVYDDDLSQDRAFGREGWQRRWPRPVRGDEVRAGAAKP